MDVCGEAGVAGLLVLIAVGGVIGWANPPDVAPPSLAMGEGTEWC